MIKESKSHVQNVRAEKSRFIFFYLRSGNGVAYQAREYVTGQIGVIMYVTTYISTAGMQLEQRRLYWN